MLVVYVELSCGPDVARGKLIVVNPLPAKLLHLNVHPLEVVSRYRDPQPRVGKN